MSGLALTALILVCAWLGVLTLVVVLLVRQIGLLTVRLSLAGEDILPDNDGPEVGGEIPDEVALALPQLNGERNYVLLLSASCTPCREMAVELGRHSFEPTITALVPGSEKLADNLQALLPSGIQVVRDPEATELAGALEVESTPFALEVEGGTVTKKAYLYSPSDLVSLVEAGGASQEGDGIPQKLHAKEADR